MVCTHVPRGASSVLPSYDKIELNKEVLDIWRILQVFEIKKSVEWKRYIGVCLQRTLVYGSQTTSLLLLYYLLISCLNSPARYSFRKTDLLIKICSA